MKEVVYRSFLLTLRIKGCDKSLGNGLDPGVLVEQVAEMHLPRNYSKVLLAQQIVDMEREFLDKFVEVSVKEITGK